VSRNDIILGLVALVLVVFSLVVSLVVPRRNLSFPGRSLRMFVVVCVLLVAAMLAAVEVLGEGHDFGAEGEEAHAGETTPTATNPTTTGAGETTETGAGETTGTGETGAEAPAGDPAAGEQVFASAGCVACHTLAAAGATGQVGPNLDESQPPYDLVIDRVTNGAGGMPSFAGQLSEEQIRNVAAYVVESTKG
jgi:mono/diheme cytochrome c family protein